MRMRIEIEMPEKDKKEIKEYEETTGISIGDRIMTEVKNLIENARSFNKEKRRQGL